MELRPAVMADALVMADLSAELGYPVELQSFRQNLQRLLSDPSHYLMVIMDEQSVQGWIHACKTQCLTSGESVEIVALIVCEKSRGRGFGRHLVESVKAWAIQQKIRRLSVRCQQKRRNTHDFYRYMGFSLLKEQKVFIEQL